MRIYFDNVMLTLHHANTIISVIAAKQTVMNEVYGVFSSIKYRYSHKLHYSADLTFRVIRKMDFNRAEPTCYRTNFPYSSSGKQNKAFSYIVLLGLHLKFVIGWFSGFEV